MIIYAFAPLKNAKFYHYYDSSYISLREKRVIIYRCGRHSPIAIKKVGWDNLPPNLRAHGTLCPECKNHIPLKD